jgi:hypothetical protein
MLTRFFHANSQLIIRYLDTEHQTRAVTKRFYCEIGNSSKAEVEVEFTTDSQSASPSWCQAPI